MDRPKEIFISAEHGETDRAGFFYTAGNCPAGVEGPVRYVRESESEVEWLTAMQQKHAADFTMVSDRALELQAKLGRVGEERDRALTGLQKRLATQAKTLERVRERNTKLVATALRLASESSDPEYWRQQIKAILEGGDDG